MIFYHVFGRFFPSVFHSLLWLQIASSATSRWYKKCLYTIF